MGYIFDALNKAGDPPKSNDPGQPDAEIDAAEITPEQQPKPALRLEDILARHAERSQATSDDRADTIASAMDWDAANPQPPKPQAQAEIAQPIETVSYADEHDAELASLNEAAAADVEQTDEMPSPFRLPGVVTSPAAARKWYQLWKRSTTPPLDDRLVVLTGASSSMAEEYRSIRTSILARHQNERHLVHTITSATPQEGKTITCMNLGLAFAELRNRKTIVIECDLRLPTFEKLLQLDHPTGLISYLHGDVSLSEIITQVPGTGLDVITAGGRVSDEAVQMLSSTRMSRLIQSLRAKYDHVIIDTPPVVDLADAGILGAQGDEVLLVARMRRTPQQLVEQAVRTLTSYNAQVAGVIATDNPRTRGRGYGYRYGYGYGYRYTYSGKKRGRRYAA